MATWSPSVIRQKAGLFLSEQEQAAIRDKLPAKDGAYCADAVFEGGGVKGTAFLGALRCFDEVGIHWKKVAGTSAGAITAALVVADCSIEELEAVIGALDYEQDLLSKKTSPFILNRSPEDDLDNPQWMVPNLLATQQLGQYATEPFKQWLMGVLGDRLRTFTDINWREGRALKVVVSDISRGEMLVLPDDLKAPYPGGITRALDFEVAEAVRLSMSIPFFFEPGQLGDSTIVDGGILSNFPLWIYDVTTLQTLPRWPTFGFRLTEDNPTRPIKTAIDIFSGMLQTMMSAGDRYHLRRNGQGRVIHLNTTGITATQFNLSNEDKDYLYRQGYEATKTFLLDEWDWKKHLKRRGYSAEMIESA